MERSPIQFKEAVKVEILTLMDNYVDVLLPGTEIAKRPALAKDGKIPTDALLAEHGLSLLVTVYDEEGNHTIQRFAEEFPTAFVLNSVGTKFEL